MSIQEIKANFHHLIDEMENEELLKKVYNLLKDYPKENESIDFWDDLSDGQKAELDTALEESEHEENLIPHDQVKQEAKTWLKK
ncbi:MAG TPA: hypothetical protein VF646_06385 [Cytophagales bacterium]|jgi:hypothetical protein